MQRGGPDGGAAVRRMQEWEQFVNQTDYLDDIKWRRLCKAKRMRLEGLNHARFQEGVVGFAGAVLEFLGDCEEARKVEGGLSCVAPVWRW